MAETAKDKQLIVKVSETESQLLSGEPNVLGLSSDKNTIVFNNKVVGDKADMIRQTCTTKSESTSLNKYYKFASIDISNGTWNSFKSKVLVYDDSGANFGGILQIVCRTGNANTTISNLSAVWESLKGSSYKDCIKIVIPTEVFAGKIDLYFQSKHRYVNARFIFLSNDVSKLTLYNNEPAVNEITVYNSSTLSNLASKADTADTADKLTNARTIDTSGAVESTATPFDGSENISIQMDSVKESYLTLGGKNLVGNVSPIDMAISSYLNANRFAYLKAEYILIEYSTDGGQTWFTQSTDTDAIKTLLFTDISYSRIYLGGTSETGINKSNYQTRITITDTSANAASLYASLKKFIIRVAGAGAGTGFACTIQGRTNANVTENIDEWVTFADKSKLQGDSGYNVINTDYIVTYGNESWHYQQLRFLFTATTTSTSTKPCVLSIHAFAYNAWRTPSTMANTGRLYSVDSSQNMIIPNHLLPDTTLTNNLGAANKSFQNVFTRFIDTPTTYNLQLKAGGTSRWQVSATSGNFLPVTDSNLNIGSKSLKVNEIYANRLVGVADKAAADEDNNKIKSTYFSNATAKGNVLTLSRPDGSSKSVTIAVSSEDGSDIEMPKAVSVPIFDGFKTSAVESVEGTNSWRRIVFVVSQGKFMAEYGDSVSLKYTSAFNNKDNDNPIKDTDYQDENGVLLNKVFRCNNTLYRYDYYNLVEVNRQLMLDVLVEQNQLYIRTNRPLVTGEKFYFMRKGKYTTGYQEWGTDGRDIHSRKGWRRYQPYPNDGNFTPYIDINSDNSIAVEYVDTCNVTTVNTTAVGAKYWTYKITGITVENLIKQFGYSSDDELAIRNGSKKRKLRVATIVGGVTQIPLQKQRVQLQYGIAVYTRIYNRNITEGFVATQEERVSDIAPFKLEIRNWRWGDDNEHEYMIVPRDFQNGDMRWLNKYASIKA